MVPISVSLYEVLEILFAHFQTEWHILFAILNTWL